MEITSNLPKRILFKENKPKKEQKCWKMKMALIFLLSYHNIKD